MKINPILDHILVTDINFGEQRSQSGIIIRSDNGKSEGVKPRWGRVYAVGPDCTDIKIGEWLLIEHGRWTRGLDISVDENEKLEVFRVDPEGILLVAAEKPNDLELGQHSTPTQGASYTF